MAASTLVFEAEKRAYWQVRDELLNKYSHQWVAIVGGQVVAVGDSADQVMETAFERVQARAMYINKVGDEDTALRKKIRQVERVSHSDADGKKKRVTFND